MSQPESGFSLPLPESHRQLTGIEQISFDILDKLEGVEEQHLHYASFSGALAEAAYVQEREQRTLVNGVEGKAHIEKKRSISTPERWFLVSFKPTPKPGQKGADETYYWEADTMAGQTAEKREFTVFANGYQRHKFRIRRNRGHFDDATQGRIQEIVSAASQETAEDLDEAA